LHGPGTEVQPEPVSHWLPGGHSAGIVHAPAPHSTSHAHEVSQSTPPLHEPLLVHSTRQYSGPQVIGPLHASRPGPHSIRQLSSLLHMTPPAQDPSPWHSTLHGTPGGQVTSSGHESVAVQVILQTPSSHTVHSGGQ
jgi:hypothetical protein